MTGRPSIAGRLRALALERPEGPAILAGGRLTSWGELDAMTSRAAANVAGHRTVALIAAPSTVAVAVLHGALRGDFRLLVINRRASSPEIDRLIATGGPSVLVADSDRTRTLGTRTLGARPEIRIVVLDDLVGGSEPIQRKPAERDPAAAAPVSAGEILVATSGTTGTPRLARLSAGNLEASATAWSAMLPASTGWLLSLGLAHVAGIGIVVRAVRDGVPLVIPDDVDPEAVVHAFEQAHDSGIAVSHLSLVATQLGRLLDHVADARPPESVRAVLLGGGPIRPSLVSRAVRAGWPVVPTYGMTETASGVTALRASDAADRPISAGRALPGVELRIGDRGELLVRGPMVFGGYVADEVATAATLGSDGWLRTGDVATIADDGFVTIVDRLDDLIISGGENIAPVEIEATLLEHPEVADAGVIGVPDATWGRVPVAVVVPRTRQAFDVADLLAFARSRMASFKIPARVIIAEELPRSPSGKLLRRRLARLVASSTAASQDQGVRLAVVDRPGPPGTPTVVLLHATLASAASLSGLAAELSADARVLALDRRGSGGTPLEPAEPTSVATHIADALRALADAGVAEPAVIVGHSFGAVVGLELAARHPDRVAGVVAWEPPYLAIADDPVRKRFVGLAEEIQAAHASGGAPAAAERFYTAVNGTGTWDALPPRLRAAIGAAGDGALADASMPDLDPAGLSRIAVPVIIATGDRDDPLYAPIADALAARIPAAHRVDIAGLGHMAPVTDPGPIAALVRELLTPTTTREPSP